MNQQDIDLFAEESGLSIMPGWVHQGRGAKNLAKFAELVRQQALEEAATVCESAKKRIISTAPDGTEFVADWCARNVRALAQKEGKHD